MSTEPTRFRISLVLVPSGSKVGPALVMRFLQIYLPLASPCLDPFLARNRNSDIVGFLKPDQPVQVVPGSEARPGSFAVLPDSPEQVSSYPV